MEFHFDVVETNFGSIIIEADTYERALEIANADYRKGDVLWGKPELAIEFNRSYE